MDQRVLHFNVPVDDQPHEVPRGTPVLFVHRARRLGESAELAEAWFEVSCPEGWPNVDHTMGTQRVQVVDTGQATPTAWRWLASALGHAGRAYHLYEVRP